MSSIIQRNPWKPLVAIFAALAFVLTVGTAAYGIGPYTDNNDGTVTDDGTGLVWQQSDDAGALDWQGSLSYCEALPLGGNNNWRVPNIRELDSLVDLTVTAPPTIKLDFFSVLQEFYWSATSYELDKTKAWSVNFQWGNDEILDKSDPVYPESEEVSVYVRCVRNNTTPLAPPGSGTFVGGSTNVPVQNGYWLFFSIAAGCYLLFQRRKTIKQS